LVFIPYSFWFCGEFQNTDFGPEDLLVIEHVLASVRPAIEADGGIVQLAVILRLGGKCMGCTSSPAKPWAQRIDAHAGQGGAGDSGA
jgi:hypothetical protein